MPASSNKWIVGGIGGLVGGMVFAMWAMVVEGVRSVTAGGSFWGSLSTHSGVWAAPQFIGAALIRGLETSRNPNFDLGPLIPGPMSHIMNSIILGLIFVVFAYYLARSVAGLFMLGMAYGVAVFVVMWWLVVPDVDPAMQEVNGVVFFVGHLIYGGVLGLVAGAQAESAVSSNRRLANA